MKVYKLFRIKRNRPNEFFPLFIGKSVGHKIGQWIDAECIPTKGFALRPGWHSGAAPCAPWLMKKDGSMPSDRVWCECTISDAIDYQPLADLHGGELKNQLPVNGYYRFKRPGNVEWFISGSLRIDRVLPNV